MNIVCGCLISQGVWNDTIPHRFQIQSHLFRRSFGLGSLIGLEALSLVLSMRAYERELPGKGLPNSLKADLE